MNGSERKTYISETGIKGFNVIAEASTIQYFKYKLKRIAWELVRRKYGKREEGGR